MKKFGIGDCQFLADNLEFRTGVENYLRPMISKNCFVIHNILKWQQD